MKKGPVVEIINHSHEWKHGLTTECQPEVPLGMIDQADLSSLLTEGTGWVENHPGENI
jgi:hypothetical protein